MVYDERFFDAGIDRQGTRSVKWCAPGLMEEGSLPLWVADMDFPCARPIVDALRKRAGHGCYGYTHGGLEDAQAACGFWQRRHRMNYQPEQLLMMPTVISGLAASIQTLTQPGDGVIIQTPVYGPFITAVRDSGRVVMDAGLIRDEQGQYTMDYDAIEDFLKQGARLMLLCSPHNPVSRVWSHVELHLLVSLLNRYRARLVSDEIHADFVYRPHTFVPILSLTEAREDTVSLVSASKTFNIAGLQQATAICRDPDTLSGLQKFLQRSGAASGNIFALEGTKAAYTACDDWLDGLMAYLASNRRLLSEMLAELLPQARVSPMEATFLAWVDLRAYGIPHKELNQRLKEEKVALVDGRFFGKESGDGFMRINYGCPKDQLLEGVARFARAVMKGK